MVAETISLAKRFRPVEDSRGLGSLSCEGNAGSLGVAEEPSCERLSSGRRHGFSTKLTGAMVARQQSGISEPRDGRARGVADYKKTTEGLGLEVGVVCISRKGGYSSIAGPLGGGLPQGYL